ncbi:tRNA-dihydrouridine synthase 3-like protein [Eremomyces bilateralis CBS 781.70]|uniref:tRNA-dihydrouridine(47) synthase [NAD(P)(+)] n=1 Tax=Eremomyces bilateralis CBS 781.70 TaxID=1392243 RepID=A0A6G1G892_9PEZI|nr:tRNA-dihydrouridine synthase 3-like protein [Eremomyces bilateralis CBS 781.70]KAF1814079.1 tRNA-dihydrouridine synthase 3-like protein [Eremomyces bilateralis CBS 781.70]
MENESVDHPVLPKVTRATHGLDSEVQESPSKRAKLDNGVSNNDPNPGTQREPAPREKGVAPVKAEYLIFPKPEEGIVKGRQADDDAAELTGNHEVERHRGEKPPAKKDKKFKDKKSKDKGQNKSRKFGSSHDALRLCTTRALYPEFSPRECPFGEKCKNEHDIRKYLAEGRRGDLTTFDGQCPLFDELNFCSYGWKCRFVGSHSSERTLEDGRKELYLIDNRTEEAKKATSTEDHEHGIVNVIPTQSRFDLSRKRLKTEKSDIYLQYLSGLADWNEIRREGGKGPADEASENGDAEKAEIEDNRATYKEPPFRASEKRKLYYGTETPILAPLTTQGNLPFRRLCVGLGAQVTWSEMAMGMPLVQGEKGEWALLRAHESETKPPAFQSKGTVVQDYDNARDLKFGAQVAAHKPWVALKTTEILQKYCPSLRAIDLNCGCPIDLVYEQGAGSALLDRSAKLETILRSMNDISGEIPITVKIRMGTKDKEPTAHKLVKRLMLGGVEAPYPCGVAAITLHGRSREQRYTKRANWEYIAECAAVIKRMNQEMNEVADTVREPDARNLPNNNVYFVGNGDVYSHVDYQEHLTNGLVDSVMIARGALIKPWIFEEIEKGQYLDKSASERLAYIEQFVRYGLETWGSDEMGIGSTRRFLLEWLSFSWRYTPVGLLEHLPPHIQDRPPRYRGRNDLETLMASDNHRDWIKISEMFLGPAHPDFRFEPKHKSNSYDVQG